MYSKDREPLHNRFIYKTTKDGNKVKELMKRKTHLLRAKRGVSPVISTAILVAVAITVAVAVSYWMGGIAGQYTRFEKLEITSAYATKNATHYTISMSVKNTGSTDATIDGILINGQPGSDHDIPITDDATISGGAAADKTIESGQTASGVDAIHVYIDITLFEAATTVEINLHTAAGLNYPQMVTLP